MKNNRQCKALLRWFMVTLLLLPVFALPVSAQKNKSADTEKLGKALDYFTSGMYHESLLLFKALDKEYTLNARFHAFMGLCYYYEWDYQQACTYLDEAIPKIESLAPHERMSGASTISPMPRVISISNNMLRPFPFTNSISWFAIPMRKQTLSIASASVTCSMRNGQMHVRTSSQPSPTTPNILK